MKKLPAKSRSPAEPVGPVPAPASGKGRHAAHRALLFGITPKKRHVWIGVAVFAVLVAAATAIFLFTDFEVTAVTKRITDVVSELNPIAVIPLMALLPVAGFPIAVVYLIAGARFGPLLGGAIVAGVTAFHLVATHFVARSFLRGPIQRFVERRHKKLPEIPEDEHAAVALIVALLPGLPYFLRNYLLALSGIRLRTYFLVCLPVYVARSYVTILLGDLSSDPSRRGLVILIVVDILKVLICGGVIWWLRRHHQRVHGSHAAPGAGGTAPPTAAAS